MSDRELELAQLLCTRLCHDLAGPVGAVAAGVELIGGDPAQANVETLSLIGNSSTAASLKLKFMRVALGAAGAGAGDPHTLLQGYLDAIAGPGGKVSVAWPAPDAIVAGAAKLGPAWVQVVLNLSLLALEAQPGCRALALQIERVNDFTICIAAQGAPERTTVLREELLAAVAGHPTPALSAKTVHSHLIGRLVRALGGRISMEASGPIATVKARFP